MFLLEAAGNYCHETLAGLTGFWIISISVLFFKVIQLHKGAVHRLCFASPDGFSKRYLADQTSLVFKYRWWKTASWKGQGDPDLTCRHWCVRGCFTVCQMRFLIPRSFYFTGFGPRWSEFGKSQILPEDCKKQQDRISDRGGNSRCLFCRKERVRTSSCWSDANLSRLAHIKQPPVIQVLQC